MEIKELISKIMESRIRDEMRVGYINLAGSAQAHADPISREKVFKKIVESIEKFERMLN